MKKFIISTLVSIFSLSAPNISIAQENNEEKLSVKYQVNKINCLYNFILALTDDYSSSKTLKNIFINSKYNNEKYKSLIKNFEDININQYYYKHLGYPNSRQMYKSIYQFFITSSALSTDINDFSQRTIGYLTFSEHKKLFNIIREFEPVYNDLIWSKSQEDVLFYLNEMEKTVKKVDINNLFKKASTFYNADWSNEIPFIITFYPVPDKKGHSTATPMGNVETVGVLSQQKDYEDTFSIMFHEMCHSLFESQSPEVQNTIDDYFKNSSSQYSIYAYNYLNEVLATSIGNGWSYKQIKGELNKTQWYNNNYIENMSKALFPLVDSYLTQSKEIDSNFIKEYISIFSKTFPNAIYDYSNIFFNLNIYTNFPKDETKIIKSDLRKNFRIAGLSVFSDIKNKDDFINNYSLGQNSNLLIFNDRKVIDQIFDLGKYKSKIIDNNDFILSSVENKSANIIIYLKDINNFKKVISYFNSNKFINPQSPIYIIK
ncbi:MAG: hypothetical protein U0354_07690 [Candidatus Sericytochromatia bacterium]